MSMTHKIIPTGPIATNCHLVLVENELFIIDPGAEAELILAAAAALKHDSARILLTHAHVDHISAAGEVAAALKIPCVEVSPADRPLYQSRENSFAPFFPPAENLPPPVDFAPCAAMRLLELPGHTPGGSGFLFDDGKDKFLIAGDTIFAGSIGRTDLPGGDFDTLMESIHTQILTLPDDLTIYPGHGGRTTVGFERNNNPYLN